LTALLPKYYFVPGRYASYFLLKTQLFSGLLRHIYLTVMRKDKSKMKKVLVIFVLLLTACINVPENIKPVDNFNIERYLGKWYEIARLDHSFERGLKSVSAEYSLRSDGGLRVVNRGYSQKENKWKEVEGKGYFVDRNDQGFLKVSFFGPFYGSYVIFDLDRENYSYALVCGPNKSYLWLLARSPRLTNDVKKRLVDKAASLGFDTDELIYVQHDE
jgi:apolipoprotein D and lipocalin family protein